MIDHFGDLGKGHFYSASNRSCREFAHVGSLLGG